MKLDSHNRNNVQSCSYYEARGNSFHSLNNQLDKAVVLADVSLEDILTRSQHTFKSSTVQLDTLQCGLSSHSGSTGPLQQEGNLT